MNNDFFNLGFISTLYESCSQKLPQDGLRQVSKDSVVSLPEKLTSDKETAMAIRKKIIQSALVGNILSNAQDVRTMSVFENLAAKVVFQLENDEPVDLFSGIHVGTPSYSIKEW